MIAADKLIAISEPDYSTRWLTGGRQVVVAFLPLSWRHDHLFDDHSFRNPRDYRQKSGHT